MEELVKTLRPVVYESPFASTDLDTFARNIAYARLLIREGATGYNEAGIASHVIWTQPGILRDTVESERNLGIACGIVFANMAKQGIIGHIYGIDLGWSKGMLKSKEYVLANGGEIVERRLAGAGERFYSRLDFEVTLDEIIREDYEGIRRMFEWAGLHREKS
jgi:hypothetical protein